ncbi:hypothetical protein B0H14DRAFT_3462210 [Mycena olivaceomarginata]|nr:hypothetical protein B0H14DRAFT_3462210 [Mycena olivaceomarginata]
MGRRAKHLTQTDLALADQQSRRKYEATERAKQLRAAQDAATYRPQARRKEAAPSVLNLPPLSSFLKARVREPLPTKSPLYFEALGGFIRPNLAGELERWRKEPPFALDTSSAVSSAAYWFRTQDLEAVLHGVRMREQEEKILERQTQLESSGYEAGMEALRAEVVQLLADFERAPKLAKTAHPQEKEKDLDSDVEIISDHASVTEVNAAIESVSNDMDIDSNTVDLDEMIPHEAQPVPMFENFAAALTAASDSTIPVLSHPDLSPDSGIEAGHSAPAVEDEPSFSTSNGMDSPAEPSAPPARYLRCNFDDLDRITDAAALSDGVSGSTTPKEVHARLAKLIKRHEKELRKPKTMLSDKTAASKIFDLEALKRFNDLRLKYLEKIWKARKAVATAAPRMKPLMRRRIPMLQPAIAASEKVADACGKGPNFARRLHFIIEDTTSGRLALTADQILAQLKLPLAPTQSDPSPPLPKTDSPVIDPLVSVSDASEAATVASGSEPKKSSKKSKEPKPKKVPKLKNV